MKAREEREYREDPTLSSSGNENNAPSLFIVEITKYTTLLFLPVAYLLWLASHLPLMGGDRQGVKATYLCSD